MSNYHCKIIVNKTGEILNSYALDNYFGEHKYGYSVMEDGLGHVYKEDEVGVIEPELEYKPELAVENLDSSLRVQLTKRQLEQLAELIANKLNGNN